MYKLCLENGKHVLGTGIGMTLMVYVFYRVGNLNNKICRRKFTNTSCKDFVGTETARMTETRTIKHVRNFKFDYSAGLFRLCQDPRKL